MTEPMTNVADDAPQICDYEGSTYRTDFWEGQGREYEDRVERIALGRLMPPPVSNGRIVEFGAGFGRLADLYGGYEQVVLFDYSHSQLVYAREHYGDEGFLYVAGDIYNMPFAPGVFDTALMVRVLHHMERAEDALRAVRETVKANGTFILEFANKQNLKAIARWAIGRQKWSPFDPAPVEFVELHYDFHPRHIREMLRGLDYAPRRTITVSHFRIALLKRLIPTGLLVFADSLAQLTGNLWQLAPSVFVRNDAIGEFAANPEGAFWRCPECHALGLTEIPAGLRCDDCGSVYPLQDGVYNFKAVQQE